MTFQCKKCEEVYEEFAEFDESGRYPGVACPKCGSKKKTRLFGAPVLQFYQSRGDKNVGIRDSQGHDYRYKHKIPETRAERERAQKHSHMGPNPYGE